MRVTYILVYKYQWKIWIDLFTYCHLLWLIMMMQFNHRYVWH